MKLSREAIQRMISQKQGTSNVTVINQEGGGGGGSQPSITLGPLLTSLNAEAMPSAEGYLHWSGTAWEWTTPTGGDPVDLTPYALKTWVQNNYATLNDISGLLTKAQADGYYAPISFVKPYLPLAAGSSYPLTGSLYINGNNNGIQWSGDKGMLCYKPTSGWSGVNSNQWGVGSHDANGIIRSGSALERYDGTNNYTIYDSSNLDPLAYLRKDGGTVAGTLNVKTMLNVQSSAGANKVTIDGSTANIDIASGGQLTFDTDSHIAHDATNDRLIIHGNNGLLIDSDTYVGSVVNTNLVATQGYVGSSINTAIDNYAATVASTYATKTQLADYLPLAGGRLAGDLHIGPNSSSNFKKIYFGDGSYVWLGEETDDSLTIQASKNVLIKTGNGYKLTYNGYEVFTENGGTVTGICSFENDVDVSGRLSLNTDSYFEVGDDDMLYIYGDAGVYFYNRPFVGSLAASAQVALLSDLATYATITQLNTAIDNYAATAAATYATKTQLSGYLPLTAGSSKPLTGGLFINHADGLTINAPLSTDSTKWHDMSMFWRGDIFNMYAYETKYWDICIGCISDYASRYGGLYYDSTNYRWGIGTTTPAYKLDVNGEAKANYILFKNYNDGGNAGYCGRGGSATNQIQLMGYTGNTVAIGANGNIGMFFDTSNNVGIGINSPNHKLEVAGTFKASSNASVGGYLDVTGDINTRGTYNWTDGSNFELAVMGAEAVENDANDARALFYHRPKVNGTEVALTSDMSGYLPLSAGSGNALTGDLYLQRGKHLIISGRSTINVSESGQSAFDPNYFAYLDIGTDFTVANYRTNIFGNQITFNTGTNSVEKMRIDSSGNVGIGTSSPAYKLDVNGIVRAATGLMVRNGTSDAIGFDTTAMFFNKAQTGGSPITSTVATFTWDNTNQRIVVGFSATPKVGTTEVALKSDISFASRQNNVLTLTTDFLTASSGIECDDIIYASSDLKTGDSLYFGASASDDDGYGRLYADSSGNLWFQPTNGTAKRIMFV